MSFFMCFTIKSFLTSPVKAAEAIPYLLFAAQ